MTINTFSWVFYSLLLKLILAFFSNTHCLCCFFCQQSNLAHGHHWLLKPAKFIIFSFSNCGGWFINIHPQYSFHSCLCSCVSFTHYCQSVTFHLFQKQDITSVTTNHLPPSLPSLFPPTNKYCSLLNYLLFERCWRVRRRDSINHEMYQQSLNSAVSLLNQFYFIIIMSILKTHNKDQLISVDQMQCRRCYNLFVWKPSKMWKILTIFCASFYSYLTRINSNSTWYGLTLDQLRFVNNCL